MKSAGGCTELPKEMAMAGERSKLSDNLDAQSWPERTTILTSIPPLFSPFNREEAARLFRRDAYSQKRGGIGQHGITLSSQVRRSGKSDFVRPNPNVLQALAVSHDYVSVSD